MKSLRDSWRDGENTLGLWASAPTTASAEILGQAGLEYVCVDNQHGVVDYQITMPMIQAILLGGSNPIVRVPWNEPGIIGKMLDAGSQGIIVPMVNSAAEAQAAVSACRYPPQGSRSFGPIMVAPRTPGYFDQANDQVAVAVMVETAQALADVEAIVATPGVDAVYVGPADLSISLGLPPGNNDGEAAFDDALATIVAACQNAGVIPGIHSSGALTPKRLEQGFKMITVATDLVSMRAGIARDIAKARSTGDNTDTNAIY